MALVDALLVNQLRAVVVAQLTQTCTLERRSAAAGGFGEQSAQWTPVAVGVKCRIIRGHSPRANRESIAAAADTIEENYTLVVSDSTPLDTDMRCNAGGGLYYYLTSVETALADQFYRMAFMVKRT